MTPHPVARNWRPICVLLLGLGASFSAPLLTRATTLELFDRIINFAAVSFGVSGAWIALVHAAELQAKLPKTGRFQNLLSAMKVSGGIVVFSFITIFACAIEENIATPAWVRRLLEHGAIGSWVVLAIAQTWCLFAMLPSSEFALAELRAKRMRNEYIQSLPQDEAEQPDQRSDRPGPA